MRESIISMVMVLVAAFNSYAAEWYHIKTEESKANALLARYYLDTSLGEPGLDDISIWVRTNYSSLPGKASTSLHGAGIDKGKEFEWYKVRYVVSCKSQEINSADSHYMLSNEQIVWDERNPYHLLRVVPDTIHDVIYHLACADGRPRNLSDIRRSAELIQKTLDSSPPDPVNTESRLPPWKKVKSTPPNMQR